MSLGKAARAGLQLRTPDFTPSRLEMGRPYGWLIHRWPWSMAVLDVAKLVTASEIKPPRGFDARQFLRDVDTHIERWEWSNDSIELGPISTMRLPNTAIGRAQQSLGNFVLGMTDDDVADCCCYFSAYSDPTIVIPPDSLGWTLYEITGSRFPDQRGGVRLLSVLEGGCRWLADKSRRCWEVPFDSWPNVIGPNGFQECRLFNFRRHSTGRDARTRWGEPLDRPAIFTGEGDVAVHLDAWRAALVWTVIESGYRLVCEGFARGGSGSVIANEWRGSAFAKFMESPNAETARAASGFLTLPPMFDGLNELNVATGMLPIVQPNQPAKHPTAIDCEKRNGISQNPSDYQHGGKWLTAELCEERFGLKVKTLNRWATSEKGCPHLDGRKLKRAKFPPEQRTYCYCLADVLLIKERLPEADE